MQKRDATSIAAPAFVLVLVALFNIVTCVLLPWFEVPAVGHAGAPYEFTAYAFASGARALLSQLYGASTIPVNIWTPFETWGWVVRVAALADIACMVVAMLLMWRFRATSARMVRRCFAVSCMVPCLAIALLVVCNASLHALTGQVPTLANLTSKGFIRLTYVPLAQLFSGLAAALSAERLLAPPHELVGEERVTWSVQNDGDARNRTRLSLIVIAVVVPLIMGLGIVVLGNRSQVFISLCLVIAAMAPFAWSFEHRGPQAREIVLIAVMTALSVAGRLALFMVPQVKPTSALVIISGIWLGPEAGCLVGMLSAFTSNFFFGQGPWTPWQMFGFGCIGFLAGVLFKGSRKSGVTNRALTCIYGFISVMLIYGPIVDTSSVLYGMGAMNARAFGAVYLAGVPFNFVHAVSTALFLFFLANPMGKKLARILRKYGIAG